MTADQITALSLHGLAIIAVTVLAAMNIVSAGVAVSVIAVAAALALPSTAGLSTSDPSAPVPPPHG